MKSFLTLFSYLMAGVSGLGLAAYVSSLWLAPSQAKEINTRPDTVKVLKKIEASLKKTAKPKKLIAQVDKSRGPFKYVKRDSNKKNPTDINSDIVVEGEKKGVFDLRRLQNSFEYNPKGKRDPFAPYEAPNAILNASKPVGPVQPLQKYSIEQLSVQGIIWGVEDPVAMVAAPSKKVYYVREREKIGNNNGYVAQIREGEIVVVESFMHRGNITSQVKVLPLEVNSRK